MPGGRGRHPQDTENPLGTELVTLPGAARPCETESAINEIGAIRPSAVLKAGGAWPRDWNAASLLTSSCQPHLRPPCPTWQPISLFCSRPRSP
jgi:hypothetical protein